MRICLIAPPWLPVPPVSYGGTEAVLDTLARGLRRAGCDVLLVTTGDATCPVERSWTFEEALGTDVGPDAVPAELRHVVHAYEVAEQWGAHIVHDHTVLGPLVRPWQNPVPVVTTNHGPFTNPDLEAVYGAIQPDIGVIAISEHHASTANGRPPAAVIHHGVDTEAFPVGDGRGGYAAFLGRMHPNKGVDAACRVARRAGVPLRIAAKMREPAEHEYFDSAVRPLLDGDVQYVGEVGPDDKLALLGGATALLNPIVWPEPFGMVMVESLACGTPVVARPRGAAPELITDGVSGFLREDEDALAAALLDAGDLDRDRCRREAETRFSADRMVADHVEVYVAAVSGRLATVSA